MPDRADQQRTDSFPERFARRAPAFAKEVTRTADRHGELFRELAEPMLMAEQGGFRVIAVLSSAPRSIPEQPIFLPRSVGMVLQRRHGEIW